MTRTIRPYADGDMAGFVLAPGQVRDFGTVSPVATVKMLAGGGRAFTLRNHDGAVLLIAGVFPVDEGYGHAWAFMSAEAGPHMRWLTAKVRGYLDTLMSAHRRVEMMVRADYAQALRWAGLLGFENEGALRMAAPDGGDMLRFARVNPAWRPVWDMAA